MIPIVIWLIILTFLPTANGAVPKQPNFVLVIADDHGWPYYSFMQSPLTFETDAGPVPVQDLAPTPNLQTLADEGVVFTRGYSTASICIPAFRTFLSATGIHGVQWVQDTIRLRSHLEPRQWTLGEESGFFRTLPRELARYGYVSWQGGKLWAGTFKDSGFTDGMALVGQRIAGGDIDRDGTNFGRKGWDTATCGSTSDGAGLCPALDPLRTFLDGAGSQPFFVWFAPLLPHQPYNAPKEYSEPLRQLGLAYDEVAHFANIRWFDELLGELLQELERRGLRENTLLIYASDNGWGVGLQTWAGNGRGKGTGYDFGFRTPIIFSGLSEIAPALRDDLVSTSDISATILSYVEGARIPPDSVGLSLRARLEGGAPVERDRIITHYKGDQVLEPPWRYIRNEDGSEELYAIEDDPLEYNDLSAANPAIVATLRKRAQEAWMRRTERPNHSEIVGRIVDATGNPLPGHRVRYGSGRNGIDVLSDQRGEFLISPVSVLERPLRIRNGQSSTTWAGAPLETTPLSMAGLIFELESVPWLYTLNVPTGGRLFGRVVDAHSGEPVAGARVRLRSNKPKVLIQNISDGQGYFRLEALPVAEYRLYIKASGYRPVSRRDITVPSTDDLLTLQLEVEKYR